VLDYRIGSGSTVDLETLLALAAQGALGDLSPRLQRSTFTLSGSLGRPDPTRLRRALQMLPSFEVTAPSSLNTIEFARAELPVSGFYPLRPRVAVAGTARIGRVWPYGKTVAGDSIGALAEIQLRDVLLTAGGTGSVRGWGNGLLGPKLLNLQFESIAEGDSVRITGTDGYIPAGGLARATASVELRLPFPGLGPNWGTHVFLDAGRVWSSDQRLKRDDNDEERWFFGTGAGIDLATIIGPVRISLGYKLNPSVLDVRSAGAVLDALTNGRPITSVAESWKKRLHLHVSLGQTF
jgi:outer membrane protein insertion porin family